MTVIIGLIFGGGGGGPFGGGGLQKRLDTIGRTQLYNWSLQTQVGTNTCETALLW